MGNTATCPSDMCGANKEFGGFQSSGRHPAKSPHEQRKIQTFHRYAEEGDVKGLLMLCHLAKNTNLSIDSQDDNGLTALHKAARNGHLAACKALIKNGANPHLRSTAGSAPVDLAQRNHRRDCADYLKKAMAQAPAQAPQQERSAPPLPANMQRSPLVGQLYVEDPQHSSAPPPRRAFSTNGMDGALPSNQAAVAHPHQYQQQQPHQDQPGLRTYYDRSDAHIPARWGAVDPSPSSPHTQDNPPASPHERVVSRTVLPPKEMSTQVEAPSGVGQHLHNPADVGAEARGRLSSSGDRGAPALSGSSVVVRDMDTQTSQKQLNPAAPAAQDAHAPPAAPVVLQPRAKAEHAIQTAPQRTPRAQGVIGAPQAPPRSANNVLYDAAARGGGDAFDAPSNSTKTLQTRQPVSQGIAKFTSLEQQAILERQASNPTGRLGRTSSTGSDRPPGDRPPRFRSRSPEMQVVSPIAEQSVPSTGESTPPRFQCV